MTNESSVVTKLMTPDVITASPDTSVTEAAQTLLTENVGSIVVVDDDRLVGIVTSTDLVTMVSDGSVDPDETIEQYMTEQVVTAAPNDTIRDAAGQMIINEIKHLPVRDPTEGIVGMLSSTDLTAYLSYDSTGS